MDLHDRFALTRVINARGSYTPLGVSRSSPEVGAAVAQALQEFFVIDELQRAASRAITTLTGAEAGAVTHCVAAGITLCVAGAMAGVAADRIAALPDARGMRHRVVLPAGHAVDYGHPLLTDVRLAGATPVLAGTDSACSTAELEAALAHPDTACLLLVSSRLVRGLPVDLAAAVRAAHRAGVPAIIDGAAQDMRIAELLDTGADVVLVSAHKYLASATAGLIIGGEAMVRAARAQDRGIGRAMKATKEGIVSVLAALEQRALLDMGAWRAQQRRKVDAFVADAQSLPGVDAAAVPDPAGMPFARVRLTISPAHAGLDAAALADALRSGTPPVWLLEGEAAGGRLTLELVALGGDETAAILARLAALVGAGCADAAINPWAAARGS